MARDQRDKLLVIAQSWRRNVWSLRRRVLLFLPPRYFIFNRHRPHPQGRQADAAVNIVNWGQRRALRK